MKPMRLAVLPLSLWLAACAIDEVAPDRRAGAADRLAQLTGGPVALEVGESGATRVVAMAPWFPLAARAADPAAAAHDFLVAHRDAFDLDEAAAAGFVVARVDDDRAGAARHVTLQRVLDGVPVFQGAITVHMDPGNGVFRALGDESYRAGAPRNRRALAPIDAAVAAGRALGLGDLAPAPVLAPVSGDGRRTTFASSRTRDPIVVEPQIVEVGPGDARHAYQALVSWLDDTRQQHYELALIDAEDGALLARHSLVNAFTGRVYTASPGAAPVGDTRVVVSFNGAPAASPAGWVDATRKTRGNNAISATDHDGNNVIGPGEVQPTADALDAFDFPLTPPASFDAAAVTNAFYFANDWHDRTYLLGFTEAAGNFQTSNFGRGGTQNDELQQDVQDGAGTNNANFATPPDGVKPRMQLFRFTIVGGGRDSAFDSSVVYHEHTHGLSNRLVGGGTTACLGGLQSGGMGEGWSDFFAASFTGDPVIGAYVTGNPVVGIRRFSMASSPLTYDNIKDGTLDEVHDLGELWAAALWDLRTAVGAPVANQLVVTGMKLTPCNPTMLQARDGIESADAIITGGANRCAIFAAFARRMMGSSASSPNHNSTTAIIPSGNMPPECSLLPLGPTRNVASSEVPRAIPDNNAVGVRSAVTVAPSGLDLRRITVDVNITHTFRGDLVIQVISPTGEIATLSNRAGGAADNFVATGLDITASFARAGLASGRWQLFVRDLAAVDVGRINAFAVHVTSSR